MTEAEWLATTEPYGLIQTARRRGSERKQRLFGVACCRRISHLLIHEEMRSAVEIGEQFADGLVSEATREAAYTAVDELREHVADAVDEMERGSISAELLHYSIAATDAGVHLNAVLQAADAASMAAQLGEVQSASPGYYPGAYYPAALAVSENISQVPAEAKSAASIEHAAQAGLLRDIFGNPFRPVPFESAWLTSTVVAIAQGMYESRDFSAMPILADALQDAGCGNDDILNHCRGDGPHIRGCWVVDLVLGKE